MRKFFVILISSIALILCLAVIGLQTDFARKKIEEKIISFAKKEKILLSFSTLEGTIPFHIRLKNLTIRWKEDEFIALEQANLRINLIALLRGSLRGKLTGEIKQLSVMQLGSLDREWKVKAHFYFKNGELVLEQLLVTSDLASITAHGTLSPDFDLKQAQAYFRLPNLTLVSNQLVGAISGNAELEGTKFEAKIESKNLKVQDEIFSPLSAAVHAKKEDGKWRGKIQLLGDNKTFPLNGETTISYNPSESLNLEEILLKGPEMELGASFFLI